VNPLTFELKYNQISEPDMQANNQMKILEQVDSTNNYAMGQAHAGMAVHGQAWLALEQTKGKGQHGKQWQAAKGDNITMSVLLDASKLPLTQQFRLSATVAAACHAFMNSYTNANLFIKWPNDIYWNDRKAGGILIENILQGQNWRWAVAGMGMNINQEAFPEHLSNPISLRQITGLTYIITDLAAELHQKVLFYHQQLINGNWKLIYDYYNSFLYRKGEPIELERQGHVHKVTFTGITEEGKLMTAENSEAFAYQEVKVKWQP
jgi:BirA family transcriptional regulator, biotin operon repressor / biotin---[acetyl-CoA-carboxylase] ligase